MEKKSLLTTVANPVVRKITSHLLGLLCAVSSLTAADKALDITLTPRALPEKGSSTLELTLKNHSQSAWANLRIVHRWPQGLDLQGAASSQGSCTLQGNLLQCRVGDLAAGASITISLTGRVVNPPIDLIPATHAKKITISLTGRVVNPVPVGKEVLELHADSALFQGLEPLDVFDHLIVVFVQRDFGDAPDVPYPTLTASNGARHRVGPLFLGNQIDAEPDGQPSPNALRDDINPGPDDEDGIRPIDPLVVGSSVRINVLSSGAGYLSGWIDYNRNGVWEAAEEIFNCVPVVAGLQQFTTVVPATALPGASYARFRLGAACVNAVTGYVDSGEVEDYRFKIRPKHLEDDLEIASANGRLQLRWNGPESEIEAADDANGVFRKMRGVVSPLEANPAGAKGFFRIHQQDGAFDIGGMLREADLVFEGTVTDIQYRQSRSDDTGAIALPHTFVRFQVNGVLKGQFAGQSLCLRFLGGPAADGRVLTSSHSTLFDLGERSILFVRRNGQAMCPLVGGSEGRFRIVEGKGFTEDGRELVWTEEAQLAFGASSELDEVRSNQIGSQLTERHRVKESDSDEAVGRTPSLQGERLTGARLREIVRSFVGQLREDARPFQSCDPDAVFHVHNPKVSGPRVRPASVRPERVLDAEGEALKRNLGNPVLPKN
jgi:GEVED domain/Domain of unknown function DUF11